MRICLVTHTVSRGDGQGHVNLQVAKAAIQEGHLVIILAKICDPDLAAHPKVEFIAIPKSPLPTVSLKNLHFAQQTASWIRRNRNRFDVLNGNGFITWVRADVVSVHFVHSAWIKSASYPFRGFSHRPYDWYQRLHTLLNSFLERRAFHAATRVIAVSPQIAAELEAFAGVAKAKIVVITNGVDTEAFQPRPANPGIFGLPCAVPLFLFAGDLKTSRKNLDTVLAALVQLPGVHLAVAGSLRGSVYPQLARTLVIADRVHFLDSVVDMPRLMNVARAFVLPSRYEPLGLVILEAMASGLPVITASTVGAAEILGDPERTLADPNDVPALTILMRALANDEALCRDLGTRNRQIALQHTWSQMASAYLEAFDQVAKAKKQA